MLKLRKNRLDGISSRSIATDSAIISGRWSGIAYLADNETEGKRWRLYDQSFARISQKYFSKDSKNRIQPHRFLILNNLYWQVIIELVYGRRIDRNSN